MWREELQILQDATNAVTTLVARCDPAAPVPGLSWDAGDVAAHLVTEARRFTEFADGSRKPDADLSSDERNLPPPQRVALVNQRLVDSVTARSGPGLALSLQANVTAFIDTLRTRDPDDDFASWEGNSDLAIAAATMTLEMAVHGRDIARAAQRPWRIPRSHAIAALPVMWHLLPSYVNADAIRGVRAAIDIRPRGSSPVLLRIADGAATVQQGASAGADCRISADPATLLLLAFGRISMAAAAARAGLIAYGRRPWLALRMPAWFLAP